MLIYPQKRGGRFAYVAHAADCTVAWVVSGRLGRVGSALQAGHILTANRRRNIEAVETSSSHQDGRGEGRAAAFWEEWLNSRPVRQTNQKVSLHNLPIYLGKQREKHYETVESANSQVP
jgi:hypothetical protein